MNSIPKWQAAFAFGLILISRLAFAQADTPTSWPDDEGMAQRLGACAVCHGQHGEGAAGAEYFPHLAGKPAGYLFAQMQGFRDGRRHYPQMVYLMSNWNDAWFARVAAFYASQPTPEPHAQAAAKLEAQDFARAQKLVREGDASVDLPPCAACHGDRLEGLEPGIPALAGLPTDYLIAQLGGWLTGARHSIAPDCMSHVVTKLQPGDIRLVATYLSSLSVSPDDRPAPEGSRELPLSCGGAGQFDPTSGVVQ
jgi:cytochrome c553